MCFIWSCFFFMLEQDSYANYLHTLSQYTNTYTHTHTYTTHTHTHTQTHTHVTHINGSTWTEMLIFLVIWAWTANLFRSKHYKKEVHFISISSQSNKLLAMFRIDFLSKARIKRNPKKRWRVILIIDYVKWGWYPPPPLP